MLFVFFEFNPIDDIRLLGSVYSASLDCSLYSDSGFTALVSSSYNNCAAGANLSKTFTGTSSTAGLAANTAYYLKIEPQATSIADASTTTYNITVAATEGY